MKTLNRLMLLMLVVLSVSCKKNDSALLPEIKDGFALVINDSVVYNYTQIDYYDFSAHLIYLKDGNTFSYEKQGAFKVYADNTEIYAGDVLPGYSSYRGDKPIINCLPSYYKDYIIPVSFYQITDTTGKFLNIDPRGDSRIMDALKKYNQFYNGLSCKIDTIIFTSNKDVTVNLVLTNNDDINYYYLDPKKMGTNLFHYYTNGLYTFINNSGYYYFFNKDNAEQPKPYYYSWDKNWLSLLKSKESTKITISYTNFEPLSKGTYNMFFSFPGLSHQVEKKDLQQDNGRIWLGELQMTKKIKIE